MNCAIEENVTGIYLRGMSFPAVMDCQILNNSEYGVFITDDAEPNLGGSKGNNILFGSGLYDVKRNYWGTMNLDTIAMHIYDYFDDNSLGFVEVEPLWDGERGIAGSMTSGVGQTPYIYSLKHPYPNPFEKNTNISYSIKKYGLVAIKVYDVTGRCVRILEESRKEPGIYNLIWNGCDNNDRRVSTGVYYIRLEVNNYRAVRKLILIQ
jgi:parallel beta-helix repeat protein